MGTDIHCYVEYEWYRFTHRDTGKETPVWRGICSNVGERNYLLFGIMAGVRIPDICLIEPRGMPEGEYSSELDKGYWFYVRSRDDNTSGQGYDHESVAEWVENGSSCWRFPPEGRGRDQGNWVSDPDSHTHSWMTTDEFSDCLDRFVFEKSKRTGKPEKAPADYLAMLATMRSLEQSGRTTRLVFWFDS